MKYPIRILTLIALLALALLPTQAAYARGAADGQVVFGSTYTVKSGETFQGDLVVFGGVATVEAGAQLTGNLVVIGGSLTIEGSVNGDAVMIGGATSLGEQATVGGDVVTIGGTLQRAEGARILGQVVSSVGPIIGNVPQVSRPGAPSSPSAPPAPAAPVVGSPLNMIVDPLSRAAGVFFRSLVIAVLAMLIVMFLPEHTQRVARAAVGQPIPAGGIGCLTIILAPAAIILLAITILLLPVAAIAVILLVAAVILGEAALGLEIGQRLMHMLSREAPLPVAALIGTFLLALVVDLLGLNWWGWFAPILVTILALGGVLMTRFGTRTALPPAPPTAPVPVTPSEPIPPAG